MDTCVEHHFLPCGWSGPETRWSAIRIVCRGGVDGRRVCVESVRVPDFLRDLFAKSTGFV
jgi:hypothetical protein